MRHCYLSPDFFLPWLPLESVFFEPDLSFLSELESALDFESAAAAFL